MEPGKCRVCGEVLTMLDYGGWDNIRNEHGDFLYRKYLWECPTCKEINVDTEWDRCQYCQGRGCHLCQKIPPGRVGREGI